MRLITALVLVTVFVSIVAACLVLAPSEDEMTPLIDQVGQWLHLAEVAPIE